MLYVKTVLDIIEKFEIKGIAHITGGGFIENIPRIIPKGLGVKIDRTSYALPKLFVALQEIAGISDEKMYNTFNMGIGMVMAVSPEIQDDVVRELEKLGEKAYVIGEVVEGSGVTI